MRRCYCTYKGTEFLANHNLMQLSVLLIGLLLHLQRYWISSKSQPVEADSIWQTCCYCTYKGTEFLANHNSVVIIIFCILLLLHLQRYWISSKSQRIRPRAEVDHGCYCTYKGTEFLANHNWPRWTWNATTLLLHLQRYWISSKSQRCAAVMAGHRSCYCTYKGTEFLANHHSLAREPLIARVVIAPTKVLNF